MTQRFSASNAGRIMACPASANLDVAIPNWVEPERVVGGQADQGTMMHGIFEQLWALKNSDLKHMLRVIEYVAELRSTRRFKALIEETVVAEWLLSKPKTTADLVLYTQDEIHVLDTKMGKIPVSVHDNAQLKFYALCYSVFAPKAKGVTAHILQPMADNMESVFISAAELKVFMDEAIRAELLITNKSIAFGPSDYCTFCPANPHGRGGKGKPYCPTMMGLLYPQVVDDDAILNL